MSFLSQTDLNIFSEQGNYSGKVSQELLRLAKIGLWAEENDVPDFISAMQERLDDSDESDDMWIKVNSIIEAMPNKP